jgi:hypothetical protein
VNQIALAHIAAPSSLTVAQIQNACHLPYGDQSLPLAPSASVDLNSIKGVRRRYPYYEGVAFDSPATITNLTQ